MNELIIIFIAIIERSFIFSLMAAAAYLTSCLIKFDDLSSEGSFCMGGAMTALFLSHHWAWPGAICVSLIAGALTGICTGVLYTQLKISPVMSGIISTSITFSIALATAGSTLSLLNTITIFSISPLISSYKIIILIPLVIGVLLFIRWVLTTQIGYVITACGDNPRLLSSLGKSISWYQIITLACSNSIAALAGSLFVQYTGYFSIWVSVGVLVIAIASLMLARLLNEGFGLTLIAGAFIYQMIIALTFEFNVNPQWNKLIAACLIIILITVQRSVGGSRA